jgi:hypothetical protein
MVKFPSNRLFSDGGISIYLILAREFMRSNRVAKAPGIDIDCNKGAVTNENIFYRTVCKSLDYNQTEKAIYRRIAYLRGYTYKKTSLQSESFIDKLGNDLVIEETDQNPFHKQEAQADFLKTINEEKSKINDNIIAGRIYSIDLPKLDINNMAYKFGYNYESIFDEKRLNISEEKARILEESPENKKFECLDLFEQADKQSTGSLFKHKYMYCENNIGIAFEYIGE